MSDRKSRETIALLQGINAAALRAKSDLRFISRSIGEPKMGGVLPGSGFRENLDVAIRLSNDIGLLIADELRDVRSGLSAGGAK